MTSLETLISNLLLQHNCVVIPSFGGFVAQRVPARFDEKTSSVHPPKKSVLFNKQLIANDGLLVQAYAVHSKLNFTEAEVEVRNQVAVWEKQLNEGNRIQIDKVGILFLDRERNICFEQDRFYNLLMQSFGLSSVHFVSVEDVQALNTHQQIQEITHEKPVTDNTERISIAPIIELVGEPVPVVEHTAEEQKIIPVSKKRKPYLRYAAAAVALPILFYSVWIPMKTDVLESGIITSSDFNPFKKQEAATYQSSKELYQAETGNKKEKTQLPENVSTYSYALDEDTYIPVKLKNSDPNIEPVTTISTTPTISNSGYVIVGSYSTIENAQKQVDHLVSLGFTAEILQRDGKIRVTAGKGNQFGTLKARLAEKGLDCWLLD